MTRAGALRFARLAALNCVWVVIITVNSRVVNQRLTPNILGAMATQLLVSLAYFTLVKQIQQADGAWARVAYVLGGSVGAGIGILVTGALR